ncbi:MarR family winged helix-turn-helix transcriptional regulator [Cupriavidus sp. UYPR2.512]|uniref:MarR family winged helix-turn-helix transcriptional regulator n=1 Tax=Cupriavidus sp. UYPR2.512 TaxID=1080187 RepID=UPI000372D877|nr:winged helix DNA-binding protein [Cupriavidus sp. UYPR2.512]UIF84842.1 winged helix DNA-binding protein [Cupriavidus necator]
MPHCPTPGNPSSPARASLASKLVGALVKRDLVQREISTEDARQVCLFLTEAGVDLVRRAEPLGIELEAGFLHCLTPARAAVRPA